MMIMMEEKTIREELSVSISLCDRLLGAVREAESYRAECYEVGKRADDISGKLRTLLSLASDAPSLYERPIRRIVAEACKNLDRAITLVRKCKRAGILRRVVTITSATDFRKISALLDASIGDVIWLLTLFNSRGGGGGAGGALPPIATTTGPILGLVWSYVAVLQMGQLSDRVEAANSLASFAHGNELYRKAIIEEGGLPPLLKLLKETTSPDAQAAAATTLTNLATAPERARQIANELGVPTIVQALTDSTTKVRAQVAELVANMAELDPTCREEFGRENVIRPLILILADTNRPPIQANNGEIGVPNSDGNSSRGRDRSQYGRRDKENEFESPEMKVKLRANCADALWKLARKSTVNSRRIVDMKGQGLPCLTTIIEKESGELRLKCLMTVKEVCSAAEFDSDLRKVYFKTTSAPAAAVVDQLLRLIQDTGCAPVLIPAISAIGSLARMFSAKETRVIRPLVNQLGNLSPDVASEAAIALGKFTCPDNFNCVEHSKSIIEFDGVPPLVRLVKFDEKEQPHGLILLSYLAVNAGSSKALERSRVLTTLQLAARTPSAHHPPLRELLHKAIYSMELYQAGEKFHK